ncbi:Protein-export membrane protein SecD [Desulfosporosinus metallidurans]|uniref:Protein-export membrane protein SecD n=1 Tax=Desulfosporosinus metallidurans TaxID=1888891 RepID=A0A1Q8QWL8_9FIRM|nr:Protein-export membrane protein SecD [Desulfosporosinus metallidurans]
MGLPSQNPGKGMKFKIIIGTLIAVILVAGGFWGWRIVAQKGVHLVFQAESDKEGKTITNNDMDKANTTIAKRLNGLGVSEPVIKTDYDKKQIVVDIAGIKDLDNAVEVIRTTAKLTFRDPLGNVVLGGDQISDAKASIVQSGQFIVSLTFTSDGVKKFGDLTSKYIGQRIGIYLDDKLRTNPTVNTPILNGQAEITGYETMEAATNDAVLMRSGSLPVRLSIIEKR